MTTDPAHVNNFRRLLSDDGFFLVCAIDHLDDFVQLIPGSPTFADVVAKKAEVVSSLAPDLSAVLIDPLYGMGAMIAAGAVPRELGIVTALENETYTFPNGPRLSHMREGWDSRKAARYGANLLKLCWFYRPDLDDKIGEEQRALVSRLVVESREVGVPLVVEPIWHAVDGDDTTSEKWKSERMEGVVQSALIAAELGADMLKLEFPGPVDTPEARKKSSDALSRIVSKISVPWVLLSAGVGFEDFCTQLQISGENGCSGYMAGRSIWREAVQSGTADGLAAATDRIKRLNDIIRTYGRSFEPALPLPAAAAAFGPDWYRRE